MKQLKEFYSDFREINVNQNTTNEEIAQSIDSLLSTKKTIGFPRKGSQIIILGSPCSGRSTLACQIAKRYNMVYISTAALISGEIGRNSINGRKVRTSF